MTGTPSPALSELEQRASILARSIETVFENAVVVVFDRLGEMRRVSDLLERIAASAGHAGREGLCLSVQTAEAHLKEIEGQFSFLDGVSRKLDANSAKLRDLLQRQSRSIRLSTMIATNAQVVSRSLEPQDETLVSFAIKVKGILDDAGDKAAGVAAGLARADTQQRQVANGVRLMTETAEDLRKICMTFPRWLDALAEEGELDGTLARIRRAQEQLVTALKGAVTDLQVADAARQRLEHVTAMAQQARDADDDTQVAIGLLAAAQVSETLDGLEQAVHSAIPALDSIGEATMVAQAEIEQLSRAPLIATLREVAELARRMAEGLIRLDRYRDEITPGMEQLAQDFSVGASAADAIAGLDNKMHMLGMNATLMSGKLGTEGRAMTEIARQLRECTAGIGGHSAAIVKLAQLQELNAIIFLAPTERATTGAASVALSDLQDKTHELEDALAQTIRLIGKGRNAELDGVRSRLMSFVKDAGSGFVRGETRSGPTGLSAVTVQLLARIRDSYSIQAERDLHDRLFAAALADQPVPPPAGAAAGGSIDSVFF